MKKTKLSNKKFITDTVCELLPLSLLFLGMMIIFTCFSIFETVTDIFGFSDTEGRIFIPVPFVNRASMIFSLLGSAVMTVYAFRFVSHRNSADLYFSFPESRISLFNSRFTGILLCIFSDIVINGIAALLLYLVLSEYYVISVAGIFTGLISLMLVALITASSFSIASLLTGKVQNSIVLGLMILLTPGYIITELNSYLKYSLYFADADISSMWGGMKGLAFETLKSVINGEQSDIPVKNIIFSCVIALIVYFIAVYAFKNRATEIADNVKYSKKKQIVFGIWITFLISFAICPKLLVRITKVAEVNEAGAFYLLGITLSIVAYFLYMLITQKDVKAAGKLIYGVFIAFAVDVLLMGTAYGFVQTENKFLPKPEDIKGIHIVSLDSSYAGEKLKHYFVSDKDVFDVMQRSYEKAYKLRNKGQKEFDSIYDPVRKGDEYYKFDVVFNTGHGKKRRYVYMNPDDAEMLCNRLCKDKTISDAISDIPSLHDLETSNIIAGAISESRTENVQSIAGEIDARKLYELFYEDIKEHGMGTNEVKKFLGVSSDENKMIAYIDISSYGTNRTYDFYISEKDERSIAYINECFVDKRRKEVDEIINIIKNFDSYNGYKVSVDIALSNEESGGLYSDLEKEKIKKIDSDRLKNELYDTLSSIPKSRDYDCMSVSVSNGAEWIYSYYFGISDESDVPDEIETILDTN